MELHKWRSVASGPKSLLEISNFGPEFLGFYNPEKDSSQNSLETGNMIIIYILFISLISWTGICSGLGSAKPWTSTLAYKGGITIPDSQLSHRFHTHNQSF